MKVKILAEHGYEDALLGLSLNKNQPIDKMVGVADKLAHKDGGENKFLEQMVIWLDISAPRYWWSEFDTYRVGMSKQSESTMHTITKRFLMEKDFEGSLLPMTIKQLNDYVEMYHAKGRSKEDKEETFVKLKRQLPESFIQRRIVCTNYKAIRNIYRQRKNHRLPEWKLFTQHLMKNLEHAAFLEDLMYVLKLLCQVLFLGLTISCVIDTCKNKMTTKWDIFNQVCFVAIIYITGAFSELIPLLSHLLAYAQLTKVHSSRDTFLRSYSKTSTWVESTYYIW